MNRLFQPLFSTKVNTNRIFGTSLLSIFVQLTDFSQLNQVTAAGCQKKTFSNCWCRTLTSCKTYLPPNQQQKHWRVKQIYKRIINKKKNRNRSHWADEAVWMPMPVQCTDKVVHDRSTTATALRCKMLKIIPPEPHSRNCFTQSTICLE